MYDSPIADTPCDLKIGLDVFPLTSSSQGLVENTVSKYATEAGLTIHDSVAVRGQELVLDIQIPLKIGYLDPVEERSGQMARLANLGYYPGSLDEPDEKDFLCAIEEFQCDQKLPVDGDCGPQTQAKLKEAYGC